MLRIDEEGGTKDPSPGLKGGHPLPIRLNAWGGRSCKRSDIGPSPGTACHPLPIRSAWGEGKIRNPLKSAKAGKRKNIRPLTREAHPLPIRSAWGEGEGATVIAEE